MKIKLREIEMYPVYSDGFSKYGYEVELDELLWKEYCDAKETFCVVLERMDDAISEQLNSQKYKP